MKNDLKKLGISVEEVRNANTGFRKIFFGILSGFVTLESPGDYALKKMKSKFGSNIEKVETPIKSKRY